MANPRQILTRRRLMAGALAGVCAPAVLRRARAGAATIRIGNIAPYTGPAAAYSIIGALPGAWFASVNEQGGIDGRKIEYFSYDDAYSPPRTVEQARRLVEEDEVAVVFSTLGAATSGAIARYMNAKQTPLLFVASGASQFGDAARNPWTMGFIPSYRAEGRILARHILASGGDPRIGVLYQNDDFGRDLLAGLTEGLGAKAERIVAKLPFEVADPTVDSQILRLRAAGANVLMDFATPKFAAQTIRKLADLGWRPDHYLANSANSVGAVLRPAGFDLAKGVLSTAYMKDAGDPAFADDPAFAQWRSFLDKYYPQADRGDSLTVYACVVADLMVRVLRRCGGDFSRRRILTEAESLKDLRLDLLLPGVTVDTGAQDHSPVEQLQMIRFNGERYERFGALIDGRE